MIIMGSKGNKRHIKGLNAPRYFGTPRKELKYVVKPNAGRHNLKESLALLLALRKLYPESSDREMVKAIKSGRVKVNGRSIKDPKFPVGINDLLELEGEGKKYTISINEKGKSELTEGVSETSQLYKVVGKYKYKGGKIMIRLHDGRIVSGSNDISVNDSVKFASGKMEKHIKMKEGAECMVLRGEHVGAKGMIKSILQGTKSIGKSVTIEDSATHETFETLMSNIMVI